MTSDRGRNVFHHGSGGTIRLRRLLTAATTTGVLLVAVPSAAQIQHSLCADCHAANQGKPNPLHLLEWESSAHERADIGCERCHGGNPNTVDSFFAHQSIVRGRGPDTPLHPSNLPRTCGTCHRGPYAQFQTSAHAALLTQGRYDGPTCSTCHGYAAGYTLSPNGLDKQCNACHGRGKKVERLQYGADAHAWLQGVQEVRKLLDNGGALIKRTKDANLRASLERDYQQAQVPLTEAIHDGHAFVFANAHERLAVARRRAEALLGRFDRPSPK
jgi:cytochrome c554/c'-like protein